MKSEKNKSTPYLIGITGSFGTGKSLVGEILEELGVTVVDTDEIVRNILKIKDNVTRKIQDEFGESVINIKTDEYIDRKALARLVFNDDSKRKKLESIIHPEVNKILDSFILQNKDKSIIAVLIPLLFECKLEDLYDEIWCVICKNEIQIERLIKKGFTQEDIKLRINSQLPPDIKIKKSDFVIDNSDIVNETKKQIILRLKELVRLNHNLHPFFDK